MKGIYILLLYSLCVLMSQAQTASDPKPDTNGDYIFGSGTFVVKNYRTGAEIDRIVIDPGLTGTGEVYYESIFREAYILHHKLRSCILPNGYNYDIDDDYGLTPAGKSHYLSPPDDTAEEPEEDMYHPRQTFPYDLSIDGTVATVRVRYLYGDTRYGVPLEGLLTLVLTKKHRR